MRERKPGSARKASDARQGERKGLNMRRGAAAHRNSSLTIVALLRSSNQRR
ncbi:protein of unknown function [Hyphomicrobium sp. 1Nfss2.1]